MTGLFGCYPCVGSAAAWVRIGTSDEGSAGLRPGLSMPERNEGGASPALRTSAASSAEHMESRRGSFASGCSAPLPGSTAGTLVRRTDELRRALTRMQPGPDENSSGRSTVQADPPLLAWAPDSVTQPTSSPRRLGRTAVIDSYPEVPKPQADSVQLVPGRDQRAHTAPEEGDVVFFVGHSTPSSGQEAMDFHQDYYERRIKEDNARHDSIPRLKRYAVREVFNLVRTAPGRARHRGICDSVHSRSRTCAPHRASGWCEITQESTGRTGRGTPCPAGGQR